MRTIKIKWIQELTALSERKVFYKTIALQNQLFFQIYQKLTIGYDHHVLLESGRGGRYSIAGLSPVAVLEGKNHKLVIRESGQPERVLEGNPLFLMKDWMRNRRIEQHPNLPDFQGGAIGFISYDYARYIEKLPEIAKDDLETPDLYFLIFDDVLVFDHQSEELWIMCIGDERAEERLSQLESMIRKVEFDQPKLGINRIVHDELQVSMTEEEFKAAVERVREYIAQGDIFQVNLSVRQSKPLIAHPMEIYESLRALNPSPYMAYMQTPAFQIVSGSPELLIKKKGKSVSTRPIAGTRSRGQNEEEDQALANELIENEKERAEHVMLVDLERNDLGRVCRYGTVEVNEFMVIEKYSHVMHIVSNVRGELEDGKDEYDVVQAVFPGGTITGAPKVRTMEIIEELEPVRRGIYTGSIGWIGYSGDMELNIVIRTLLAKDGMAHVQAGAGVVIDSNPKYEYRESLKKAIALWRAKEQADRNILNKGGVTQ